MTSNKLAGKVAVITGGNSGIGLATAKLFKSEGAKIAFIGRDQKTITDTIESLGGNDFGFKGDVTSQVELTEFFRQVKSRFGKIDVLFANAGISKTALIAETSQEFYDEMFAINVRGIFFTVQKALPLLQRGSSIVITTSVVNQMGFVNSSVYSATKAATRSFVRCFAAELLDQGIRVNAVSPGPIDTPIMAKGGADPKTLATTIEHVKNMIPMKRTGTADEVAKAVLFMASDDSSFTTGEELMVDGGLTQF